MKIRNWKSVSILFAVLVALSPAFAAGDGARLHFPSSGFSIAPLEAPAAGVVTQPVSMALPPVGGFAPNVNVQIQPFAGSLEAYVDLTRRQLEGAGVELVAEPVMDGIRATWEYRGAMGGRQLHWYQSATQAGDSVFLVTATAPDSHWSALREQLVRAVDSFELELLE